MMEGGQNCNLVLGRVATAREVTGPISLARVELAEAHLGCQAPANDFS